MAASVTVNPITMYNKNITLLDRPHPIWSGPASGGGGGGGGDSSGIPEDAWISTASGDSADKTTSALRKSETPRWLMGLVM